MSTEGVATPCPLSVKPAKAGIHYAVCFRLYYDRPGIPSPRPSLSLNSRSETCERGRRWVCRIPSAFHRGRGRDVIRHWRRCIFDHCLSDIYNLFARTVRAIHSIILPAAEFIVPRNTIKKFSSSWQTKQIALRNLIHSAAISSADTLG